MLEALAAIGLASAIVQFTQFGSEVIGTTCNLYRSPDGILAENADLEKITADLKDFMAGLKVAMASAVPSLLLTKEELALRSIGLSCESRADELLDLLEDLKVGSTGRKRWRSMVQASKTVWNRGRIRELEERLVGIRQQLLLRMVAIMDNRQSGTMKRLDELARTNEQLEANTTKKLTELKDDILEQLAKVVQSQIQISHKVENLAMKGSSQAYLTGQSVNISELSTKLSALRVEAEKVRKEQAVLRDLRFDHMTDRHSEIKEAHRKTYEWGFDPNRSGFMQWLESQNGIFWVAGKAGSGKSTFMKFVSDHYRTKQALKVWAGQEAVFAASHYFWNAGYPSQKSQEGLLTTLLHQILKQCPDLIPAICDSASSRSQNWDYPGPQPFTRTELFTAFKRLGDQASSMQKFCFFIDGLDEFEGDHAELIRLLQSITQSPNIKLCVSSRPWHEFSGAFGNSQQKLFLQDLTQGDIKRYITDVLVKDPRFQDLAGQDAGYSDLVEQLVHKAQGVFLWVFLVLRSLLRGISSADTLDELRWRVDQLPKDLEAYFRHILEKIDETYQEQTAQIFQVARHAIRPLPFMAFVFLDKDRQNPESALRSEICPLSDSTIESFIERTSTRLNARCKDLLELTIDPSQRMFLFKYRISYLHRTVKDFLGTNDIDTFFKARAGKNFDASLSLCKIMLCICKVWPRFAEVHESLVQLSFVSEEFLRHARNIELRTGASPLELIDEFGRVTCLLKGNTDKICEESEVDKVYQADREYERGPFLALAVEARLQLYVNHTLNRHPRSLRGNGFPLLYALQSLGFYPHPVPQNDSEAGLEMVRSLLERGADPNQIAPGHDGTIWHNFLLHSLEYSKSKETRRYIKQLWCDAAEMLLEHGADTSDLLVDATGSSDPPVKVPQVEHYTVLAILDTFVPSERLSHFEEFLNKRDQPYKLSIFWRILGRIAKG